MLGTESQRWQLPLLSLNSSVLHEAVLFLTNLCRTNVQWLLAEKDIFQTATEKKKKRNTADRVTASDRLALFRSSRKCLPAGRIQKA